MSFFLTSHYQTVPHSDAAISLFMGTFYHKASTTSKVTDFGQEKQTSPENAHFEPPRYQQIYMVGQFFF